MSSINVLSTKKLKPSLAEQLKKAGLNLIEQEFIRIDPAASADEIKKFIETNQDAYVIFTSSNAVNAVADHAANVKWKVCCISGKTKETILEKLKLAEIIATAESGAELAKEIIERGIKEVLFFSGDIRRDELPQILNEAEVDIKELIVYKTVETPEKVDPNIDSILFFSPSAVKSFFHVNQLSSSAICFSIGNTTAAEIKNFVNNKVIVAEIPTQESLIAIVKDFYNKVQL